MTPPAESPSPRAATLAVTAGRPRDPGEPINPPVVLSSIYHPDAGEPPAYARSEGNPTWAALEDAVGALEGGDAVAYASGIAAIDAVLAEVPDGEPLVYPYDGYTGLRGLVGDLAARGRVEARPVEIADTDAVVEACDGAALLWVESPTNPLMSVADLPALVAAAHERGCLVAADSTFATPLRQRPLAVGADVVVHSATKYLSGHSDALLGLAVTRDEERRGRLARYRRLRGAVPGPMEAWLTLRGIRTLPVRLDRAEANAAELARRLASHPAVVRVRYPGLPDDPGYARVQRTFDGPGAMLSFEVADAAAADAICEAVRVLEHATSLGGVESTLERRGRQRPDSYLPEGLVRVSVGCEDVEDLWSDLEQALAAAEAARAEAAPGR